MVHSWIRAALVAWIMVSGMPSALAGPEESIDGRGIEAEMEAIHRDQLMGLAQHIAHYANHRRTILLNLLGGAKNQEKEFKIRLQLFRTSFYEHSDEIEILAQFGPEVTPVDTNQIVDTLMKLVSQNREKAVPFLYVDLLKKLSAMKSALRFWPPPKFRIPIQVQDPDHVERYALEREWQFEQAFTAALEEHASRELGTHFIGDGIGVDASPFLYPNESSYRLGIQICDLERDANGNPLAEAHAALASFYPQILERFTNDLALTHASRTGELCDRVNELDAAVCSLLSQLSFYRTAAIELESRKSIRGIGPLYGANLANPGRNGTKVKKAQ